MPRFIILDTDLLVDGQYFREGCPIELTEEKAVLLAPYIRQITPLEVSSSDELPDTETFRKMQDGQNSENSTEQSPAPSESSPKKGRK
jgi:hypothetical protein